MGKKTPKLGLNCHSDSQSIQATHPCPYRWIIIPTGIAYSCPNPWTQLVQPYGWALIRVCQYRCPQQVIRRNPSSDKCLLPLKKQRLRGPLQFCKGGEISFATFLKIKARHLPCSFTWLQKVQAGFVDFCSPIREKKIWPGAISAVLFNALLYFSITVHWHWMSGSLICKSRYLQYRPNIFLHIAYLWWSALCSLFISTVLLFSSVMWHLAIVAQSLRNDLLVHWLVHLIAVSPPAPCGVDTNTASLKLSLFRKGGAWEG